MNIWLLKRIGDTNYDETSGYVVIAATATGARAVARCDDCDSRTWAYADKSTCVAIGIADDESRRARVVLRDHLDG